jgi:hypothetical protein
MFTAKPSQMHLKFRTVKIMNGNHLITILRTGLQPHGLGRLAVAAALAAMILPLGGCSAGGEGTVDISSAKAASYVNTNPDMAKAAAARGKGVTGTALKTGRK